MSLEKFSTIPSSYEAWKHCITVDCNIRLTTAFIQERIAALSDLSHPHTRTFSKLYGDTYRQTVLHWFKKALQEIA